MEFFRASEISWTLLCQMCLCVFIENRNESVGIGKNFHDNDIAFSNISDTQSRKRIITVDRNINLAKSRNYVVSLTRFYSPKDRSKSDRSI